VVWGLSPIEIAVHAPIERSKTEKGSFWGWPDEQTSWTWPGNEGNLMQVKVYSLGDKVQLLLNDKILGEKEIADTSKLTAVFAIAYQKGKLKAIAFSKGKEIGSKTLTTAGQATSVRLTADRPVIKANRNDLAYITVEAIDADGNIVSNSSTLVKTAVSGEGEWLASGNASPNDMESFHKTSFKLLNGKGLIIVRPSIKPGIIEVKAESGNLKPAVIQIKTE